MNQDEPQPVFKSFDPCAELLVSERNLPHWFQPGAAIFVTFRTADSMPAEVVQRWQRELEELFHRSLDACHGACVLRDPEIAKIVGETLLFHRGTKYELDRLVVMPNHVHAIVQFDPESNLSVVSQSWMRYSARQINQALGTSGPFWQPEPFDHIIRSPEQFHYLQQYIFDNPAKAKLRPGEFLYWERTNSNPPE